MIAWGALSRPLRTGEIPSIGRLDSHLNRARYRRRARYRSLIVDGKSGLQ